MKNAQLEQRVIDIFLHLNSNIFKPDIENCYRLGKYNTIVKFVNRNVFKDSLEKIFQVNKLNDNSKLGFNPIQDGVKGAERSSKKRFF